MSNDLFGSSFQRIEAALSVRAIRQDLIASNVANAETPGYRALDVNFAATMENVVAELERTAQPTGSLRLAPVGSQPAALDVESMLVVEGDDKASIGNAQNTVNIDEQMGHLDENRLMFQATAQLAAMRLQSLKSILDEGGRRQ